MTCTGLHRELAGRVGQNSPRVLTVLRVPAARDTASLTFPPLPSRRSKRSLTPWTEDVPVVSGATSGFRLRARLAIRGRQGAPKIGMFQLGSHRVVPIPNCSVQHPLMNRVVAVVRRALVDAGT